MGRASTYTPEMGEQICKRLARGESLRSICELEGFPSVPTVLKWRHDFDPFNAQYAHARELQADHFAEEVITIPDQAADDAAGMEGKYGHVLIAAARLQADSRKWVAARMHPRSWGDKQTVELQGDINANVTIDDRTTLRDKLDRIKARESVD